jgi:hypothetical protein
VLTLSTMIPLVSPAWGRAALEAERNPLVRGNNLLVINHRLSVSCDWDANHCNRVPKSSGLLHSST